MKSKLYSIGILFILVSCLEHDISPNLIGKEKKATFYHSSNLLTPLCIYYSFYNNTGQLTKEERHTPDEGMTNYAIYSYDSRGNFENRKSYKKESGKFIFYKEDKYFHDLKNQDYKGES